MRLIQQLIDYLQRRGVLTERHMEQLRADGFFGTESLAEAPYEENDRAASGRYDQSLEDDKPNRNDRELLELESRLDQRRPVRSRIRKMGGGKNANARNSPDFGQDMKALNQHVAAGVADAAALWEPLCCLGSSGTSGQWDELAAAIAARAGEDLQADLAKALTRHALTAADLWKFLEIDFLGLVRTMPVRRRGKRGIPLEASLPRYCTGRGPVVRAFRAAHDPSNSRFAGPRRADVRAAARSSACESAAAAGLSQDLGPGSAGGAAPL